MPSCPANTLPREKWTWIRLTPWGDFRMPDDGRDRESGCQYFNQRIQTYILCVFKRQVVAAFQLNANGKIIAALAPLPAGDAGMPGALQARNELNAFAIAPDKEMRRDAQTIDRGKKRMLSG